MPDASANPYYTTDECPRCGTQVRGLHGRWACPVCGEVSPYLPPIEELTAPEEAPQRDR